MRFGPRELAIGGGALVLGAIALRPRRARAKRKAKGGSTKPPTTAEQARNRELLVAQLQALPMLTAAQRNFFVYVAYGESRYSPLAFNASTSEAKAAAEAFDHNASRLRECGYTRKQLGRGSGGRFGRLLPYFVLDLQDVAPCIAPGAINDGVHDLASAIKNAWVLQQKDGWNGTVGSLRAGWATPGDLSPAPERLAKMRNTADAAGIGAAFIDSAIPMMPGPEQLGAIIEILQAHPVVS